MHIKTKILIIASATTVVIILAFILYFNSMAIVDASKDVDIDFWANDIEKTLTIITIYPANEPLYWNDISVTNGSATLPTGTIDLNDVITDCDGFVELTYKPTETTLYEHNFEK